jgi:radical SAM-linked protein
VKRLRIKFSKLGKIRFTSHRDVARIWERTLRRGQVEMVYTQGFSPRPKIGFGLALPTGCESTAEYLDVWVHSRPDARLEDSGATARLGTKLGDLLPQGLEVMECCLVDEAASSLQEEITSCRWEIDIPGVSAQQLAEQIDRVLRAPTLPIERERKGRRVQDDLRPSVLSLEHGLSEIQGSALIAELGTRPRGVRPAELAHVLNVPFGRARRTNQWIERSGSRTEPMTEGLRPQMALSSASGRDS